MHGRLARWLRLMGIDTEYSIEYTDPQLLEKALKEERILITSDGELYAKAHSKGLTTLLIDIGDEKDGILKIIRRFSLNFHLQPERSRCPKCGSKLKTANKDSVRESVPEKSFQLYDEFWVCTNLKCKKVYWKGSHWKNIEKMVQEINKLLNPG